MISLDALFWYDDVHAANIPLFILVTNRWPLRPLYPSFPWMNGTVETVASFIPLSMFWQEIVIHQHQGMQSESEESPSSDERIPQSYYISIHIQHIRDERDDRREDQIVKIFSLEFEEHIAIKGSLPHVPRDRGLLLSLTSLVGRSILFRGESMSWMREDSLASGND